jgi:alpha-L-fucosidase 2
MMQHVWDHFDYSQDLDWLKSQGYPKLLKPIAEFWLSQLQEDQYYKDGTLVVNPCDSPEHPPTTFGCTHWQQLIFQVFETVLTSAALVSETDVKFLNGIHEKLSKLDKGLHIGRWGQIQEWKIDLDVENDTHRHLSHLVGWYPGWALSSYLDGYSNSTIQDAVETSLYSRGVGIGPDANSGWEKVWRAACWARLNNSMEAYYELRLAIYENWAPNALSMYSGKMLPFQIDANFGFPGAVLAMLIVDLPNPSGDYSVRTVVLGPAIPPAWSGGSVRGLRLRGGGCVDFSWDSVGVVREVKLSDRSKPIRLANKYGEPLAPM